jgi:hypothetical protein
MGLADNAARRAGEKPPVFKPAAKKFDWAEGYMDFVTSGGQADAMTMGGATQGKDLVQSGINIGQGKGSAGDYLTVGLAPFALAGFGAGAAAKKAVPLADKALATAIAGNTLKRGKTAQIVPDYALRKIKADQQVKNAFQAGQKEIAQPNMKMVENRTLGIPLDAPDDMRPIYQYLTTGKNIPEGLLRVLPKETRELLRTLNLNNATATSSFGGNAPQLLMFGGNKPGATFTAGDSAYMTRGANPLPLSPTQAAVERMLQNPKPVFFEVQTPPKTPLFQNMRHIEDVQKNAGIKVPVKLNKGTVKQNARQKALQKKLEEPGKWQPI